MSLNGQAHLLGEHSSDPKAGLVVEAVLDMTPVPSGSGKGQMYLNQQLGFPDGRKLAFNLGINPAKPGHGNSDSWAEFPSNFGTIRVVGKAEPGQKIRIEITPAPKKRESSSGKTYLLANGNAMSGNGMTLRVNYYEPIPKDGQRTQPVAEEVKGKKAA